MDGLIVMAAGIAGTALLRAQFEGEHWQLFLRLHAQMAAHFSYFAAAVAAAVFGVLYLSPHLV
jgi:hypothetical protein